MALIEYVGFALGVFLGYAGISTIQPHEESPLPVRCARIKLKQGAIPTTREWFQTLADEKEELIATLEAEGVWVEAVFLDHIGEDDYLIYFMKEENTEKSRAFSRSTHPLAQTPLSKGHQEYKKRCWEGKVELETLFNVDRIRIHEGWEAVND